MALVVTGFSIRIFRHRRAASCLRPAFRQRRGAEQDRLRFMWQIARLKRRIDRDPSTYTDAALAPVGDEYGAGLELFNATEAARHAADLAIARAARGGIGRTP